MNEARELVDCVVPMNIIKENKNSFLILSLIFVATKISSPDMNEDGSMEVIYTMPFDLSDRSNSKLRNRMADQFGIRRQTFKEKTEELAVTDTFTLTIEKGSQYIKFSTAFLETMLGLAKSLMTTKSAIVTANFILRVALYLKNKCGVKENKEWQTTMEVMATELNTSGNTVCKVIRILVDSEVINLVSAGYDGIKVKYEMGADGRQYRPGATYSMNEEFELDYMVKMNTNGTRVPKWEV